MSSTKNIETFIPEYRKQLVSRPIDLSDDGCNVSVVTFDLETTGFGKLYLILDSADSLYQSIQID